VTTYDMGGGLKWPLSRAYNATGMPEVVVVPLGSAKLDRQVAYQGNDLTVTATGTDGQPYTGPMVVVLTERGGAEVRPAVTDGTFSLAGVPKGRYRVAVNGEAAGPLAVL
jgi:hypothetical protein